MSISPAARRAVALTAAFVIATWGAAAVPAAAEPGGGNGKGRAVGQAKHDGKSQNSQKGKDRAEEAKSKSQGKGSQGKDRAEGARSKSQGKGKAKGKNQATPGAASAGAQGSGGGGGQGVGGASHADPLGNNGTVKVAPYGDIDGIPQNSPHPGCRFQVEWYGFDAGADIISTVTFTMQAPTSDVVLSGTSPSEVFVGEDPASGAGTETGLDAVQAYTLSFDGEPHAQQGYHVRLTVETPHSLGADTKSKVFWVDACEESGDVAGNEAGDEGKGEVDDTEVLGAQDSAPGTTPGTTDDTEVLGAQATAPRAGAGPGAAAADEETAVPTAVDAGDSNPVLDLVTSPWGWALLVIGLGAALGLGAVATRRASVRTHH